MNEYYGYSRTRTIDKGLWYLEPKGSKACKAPPPPPPKPVPKPFPNPTPDDSTPVPDDQPAANYKPNGNAGQARSWIRRFSKFSESSASCSANLQRLNSEVNTQAYSQFEGTGVKFEDPTFPAEMSSLVWSRYVGNDADMYNRYS